MPLGREVGLSPSDIVLDGDPAPPPQKGSRAPIPNFRPMTIVAMQTAGWIKTPLGAKVGLGPGDIVLYGDQASLPQKGMKSPIFGPCLLWSYGWMDQDATW